MEDRCYKADDCEREGQWLREIMEVGKSRESSYFNSRF